MSSIENKIVYDKMVSKSRTRHQYIYKIETLKKLDKVIPKRGKILDVGCGTGHIAQFLNDRKWYGVDISPKSVEIAKQFYKQVKVGDVLKKIPFPSNTFDHVVSISFLHHVPDNLELAVREIKRVLKLNGSFIAIEHDERNFWVKMSHQSFLRIVPCKSERALNVNKLKNILLKNGFSKIKVRPFDLEAEQQGLLPPLYIRIFKSPLLYLLKLLSKNKPKEFIIKAKLINK